MKITEFSDLFLCIFMLVLVVMVLTDDAASPPSLCLLYEAC